MIIGLDHGYHYTKDHTKYIFKSAFTRTDYSLSDQNKITIDGIDYYFGKGNTMTADADKVDSMINKICTLADLAVKGSDKYFLVVGLPIGQYKNLKDKFRDTIMSYNKCNIIYNDKPVDIQIEDVTVFAQGAGVLFNYNIPDNQYIVFDVGSYTINVVLIELINKIPHILNYDTWFDGILTLYANIINETNRRYNLTLDVSYAEYILNYGLSVNGEKQDTKFINIIKQDYLDNIFTKFKRRYPYATTAILLCGGGGEMLLNLIHDQLRNTILIPDAQFANAIGYYNFGVQKYGGS